MGKFSGVMIVTDLDGTLLDSTKHVDPRSREKIRYFISEGGYFTFATGRLYQSFICVEDRLEYNAPIVFANGAQIIDFPKEQILSQCPLDADIKALSETILHLYPDTACEIYRHKKCDIVNLNKVSTEHMINFVIDHELHSDFNGIEPPWIKLLFTNTHEKLCEVAEYIHKNYSKANVCFSNRNFLEVFSASTDKGKGTRRLAELLKVRPENIYTSGDQENDFDLLRAAARAYVPQNAVPAAKAIAAEVLTDNDHGFIAEMIDSLDKLY